MLGVLPKGMKHGPAWGLVDTSNPLGTPHQPPWLSVPFSLCLPLFCLSLSGTFTSLPLAECLQRKPTQKYCPTEMKLPVGPLACMAPHPPTAWDVNLPRPHIFLLNGCLPSTWHNGAMPYCHQDNAKQM